VLGVFLRESLAVLCIVFFVVAAFSVGVVFAVDGPPSSGDWIVNGTESYSDREIVLNGNLAVDNGGDLTFRRVTLKLNCTYAGQYSILVNPGGKFYVLEGSVITSVDSAKGYSFTVMRDSTFRMSDSELHYCGWEPTGWDRQALYILSDDTVVENSLISHNNFFGIAVGGSGIIRDNNITANKESGIVVGGDGINPTIYNNYISWNNVSGIEVLGCCSPIIYNNTVTSNLWAGINPHHNATPIIKNNVIMRNEIGIFCVSNSSPTISDNRIAENLGGGIGCFEHSDAIIQGNTITNNIGLGIGCHISNPTIQGNNISGNEEGIQCHTSNPIIQNNTIASNSGGISFNNSSGIMQGNTITKCGDGVVCWYSNPIIQGNSITDNTGTGVWCTNQSNPTIRGNTITLNDGAGIGCREGSQPEIHRNDIYSNYNLGLLNVDQSVIINATYNYWGSASGPALTDEVDAVDPEEVSQNVLYTPWLTEQILSAEITSPLSNEMVSSTVRVSTEVHALQGVQKVEFYIDDQLKYTDYDASYEWNWDTTPYTETEHRITAKACDNYGLKISTSITVLVDNTPPTVSIEEPLSGNTYCGTVTISVSATDNREVKDVRVRVDNSAWLGTTYNSTDLLWKHVLNTTTLSDGQHTVMSLALDKAGNPTTTSLTIRTDNNPPTLTIQSPTSGTTVGLTLIVSVQATDISNISKVEFYLHNVLVNTAYTAPYQWAWDTTRYPNGEYTITAKAYDSLGNIRSESTTVIVHNVEVPWWQANFWTIVQVFIALGGLMLAIVTYWTRTRQKRKKKPKKKEVEEVADTASL